MTCTVWSNHTVTALIWESWNMDSSVQHGSGQCFTALQSPFRLGGHLGTSVGLRSRNVSAESGWEGSCSNAEQWMEPMDKILVVKLHLKGRSCTLRIRLEAAARSCLELTPAAGRTPHHRRCLLLLDHSLFSLLSAFSFGLFVTVQMPGGVALELRVQQYWLL